MDIYDGLVLKDRTNKKIRRQKIKNNQASVIYYEKNKYQFSFNVTDSIKLKKFKYARCFWWSYTDLFFIELTNIKQRDDSYYNTTTYGKSEKTTTVQINGSGLIKKLCEAINLGEWIHRFDIGKNRSTREDSAIFLIQKPK